MAKKKAALEVTVFGKVGKIMIAGRATSSGNPKVPRRAAPRLDLLPAGPLRRVAERFRLGLRYGPPGTWKNGLDLDDAWNHGLDHLLKYRERLERFEAGERPDPRRDDDDLAAAAWACLALMDYQDREEK